MITLIGDIQIGIPENAEKDMPPLAIMVGGQVVL